MYFLFSGEGPTDIGRCILGQKMCEGNDFQPGPMVVIVDYLVEKAHNYSLLETRHFGFVTKTALTDIAATAKSAKKSLGLPGKKREKETRYFFVNARALAHIAIAKQQELKDEVVAVLFRDADTATAGRGEWDLKRQSMIDGFKAEGFDRGVPMIPKPTSEAWLVCALKDPPYQGCKSLEGRSARPKSSSPLKIELERLIGEQPTRELLCTVVREQIDIDRIQMPSFDSFRETLKNVIRKRPNRP